MSITIDEIYLQLGDIIKINAPTNPELNERIFFINNINERKIIMIQDYDTKSITLNISPDGYFSDESINNIDILSRSEVKGYARQNGLIPNTWIDIHFIGDIPITGKITNLEEDMIEIEIINGKSNKNNIDESEQNEQSEKELIYINFNNQGIPDDVPIEKIVIRSIPEFIKESETENILQDMRENIEEINIEDSFDDVIDDEYIASSIDIPDEIPVDIIKTKIKDINLEADQIVFGPKKEAITVLQEVPEQERRYSIEFQTNDLLDELLSEIPAINRNRNVLNEIHIMIERFKQLRNTFSTFDENGNANKPLFKGANYKPIVDKITTLDYKLPWILPVAQNNKKIYVNTEQNTEYDDITQLTMSETLMNYYDINSLYKSNTDNYSIFMNKVQESFTPFQINYNKNSIINKSVLENIDTVIDNFGNFESSISRDAKVSKKRFLITRYNLGLTKLQNSQSTYNNTTNKIVPLTNNDTISINSILTLEEPVMTFSNIHLPGTHIIDKSNLNIHYLNYWKLLKNTSSINKKWINNLDSFIDFNENTYLKKQTQYILNNNEINEEDKIDNFKKFINIIIPKTKILFNLIKKYINGKYSLIGVISYLQPFLIYLDDISFMQYKEIIEYIQEEIISYKTNYTKKEELFNKLNKSNNLMYNSILYDITQGKKDIGNLIFKAYGLNTKGKLVTNISTDNDINMDNDHNNSILSQSEIIKYIIIEDCGICFNTSLTLLNIDLFTPFNFDDLLEDKKDNYKKELDKTEVNNECQPYILSKKYISLDELTADNDIPIYFDKKYDPTVYDILNEHKSKQSEMDKSSFNKYLTDKLIQDIGLKPTEAKYEATSMIDKKRLVKDGYYAVLELVSTDEDDDMIYYYYKRENKTWIRDESIPDNSFIGSNSNDLFCNLQTKCIKIDKKCADYDYGNELVKQELIKEMFDEFDSEYIKNMNDTKDIINELWKTKLERLTKLRNINRNLLYKYENDKLKIINTIDDNDSIVSPYSKLLDIIMGQSDFSKKQYDIVNFVKKFTRPMNSKIDTITTCNVCDGPCSFWLYCIDTNMKLLPTFIHTLASVFVENGDYYQTINEIKNSQGIEIDDKIVDEHSGFEIEKIALSTDEGYDEAGFKAQTRDIMEKNVGDILFESPKQENKIKKELLANPKGKVINNIITTISREMSIMLESNRESIIQHTLTALDETVDSKDIYEERFDKLIKEKKKPPYKDFLYKQLLFYTLSYMSIYISVSIPSIQSKKNFPGCSKSFNGYPVQGDENISNIKYIACIAIGIKTNVYPWKTLPKSVDILITNIKSIMDNYILKKSEIKVLIDEKKNYLLQNKNDIVPEELDIKKWINFLPPLQEITNKTPSTLDDNFKTSFKENQKTGSKKQFEQIQVIKSKIIYFSLSIIKAIQSVVSKENPILTNSSNNPFLQNACCNNGEYKTIDYFIKRETSILTNNEIVNYLYNINYDMINMSQSAFIVDPQNTKMKFPPISNEFSQSTIIKGYINFCHYNTEIPINNTLLESGFCLIKPEDYDDKKTIDENVKIIEKSNNNYSLESFNNLLTSVNKLNIIPLDLVHTIPSSLSQSRDLIDHMINSDHITSSENVLNLEFLNLYKSVLDSYDITNNNNNNIREFKNYLGKNIDIIQNNIFEYLHKHSDLTPNEKLQINEFIHTIMDFNINGNRDFIGENDDTLFRAISFVKTSIFEYIKVIPNIIINKVNYKEIKIPKHWKLSDNHNNIIKDMISSYYKIFEKFYNDPQIIPYLNQFQDQLTDFIKLVEYTHLYASIIDMNDDITTSILDNKTSYQLFKYFFLNMINSLFNLTNDKELLKDTNAINTEENIDDENTENDMDDNIEEYEIDIITGKQRSIREKIANITVAILQTIKNNKKIINYNSEMIKNKINIAKDKERHEMTSRLRDMDKKHREVENLMKKHRLGENWNTGLQKGLTQYVAKTFDKEFEEREKRKIIEKELEDREKLLNQAMTADKEIMIMEHEEDQLTTQRIEAEEYDMSGVVNDDDHIDDDDYRLEFEEDE